MRILMTGATGYVGGRLVPRLLEEGHAVRCMVRDPARLEGRPWLDQVEVVRGDVLDEPPCRPRSLASGWPTTSCTAWAAATTSTSAMPGPPAPSAMPRAPPASAASSTSAGWAIRQRALRAPALAPATGDALREAGVPVTEFRAAVIVGSGSVSFEMIRYLTERVPRHDLSALGVHAHPADRDPRRARLSRGRARHARPAPGR